MRETGRLDTDWNQIGVLPHPAPTAFLSGMRVPPETGFWHGAPLREDTERTLKATLLTLLLATILVASRGIDLMVLAPFIALIPATAILLDSRKSLRPTLADLALMENPDDSEICLVRLSIYRGERRVGLDRGIAWFAEDRLHFAGRATSFALGGQDIVPTTGRRAAPSTVDLRHPEGEASLILVPLAPRTPVGNMQRACFAYRFEAFRSAGASAPGPRQWPPLEPKTGATT